MTIEEIKETAASIRQLSLNYNEIANLMGETNETIKPLRKMVGDPDLDGKAKGSRLIAAGIALIAFPDPTISDAVGTALIVSGVVRNRMKQTTVADMQKILQGKMKELKDITRETILG